MRRFAKYPLPVMLALLIGLGITFLSPLHAQTFYGSVVGTVTDSSGAIVPGATVTLTDVGTNEKHTAQSNAAGEYSFVSLVPSTYSVDVQKANFKRFLREQVVLQVDATVRVDVAMQVGTASETVEVTTETPQLQTDSATLGDVVEGKVLQETPLNGRNVMNLLALAPGVQPRDDSSGGAALGSGGSTHNSNWSDYSIGGGLPGQSAMYLDGMPLNVLGGGGGGSIEFVPTQDAIQEFSVASNASTSEFGRYSGGVVNMTTRSGTNNWHGTAYEFVRNNVLNANEWWNKRAEYQTAAGAGTLSTSDWNKRPKWDQNQYGVEVAGPIKKDKVFGMFSWEQFSAREASLQQKPVPTADMLNGVLDDFSAGTAAQAQVYANDINALKPSCNAQVSTVSGKPQIVLNGGASIYKAGTANGCYDSTALVIATEWPAANFPTNTQNNFQEVTGYGSGNTNYIGRVDYNLSQQQRLFARFTFAHLQDISQEWMPGGIEPGGKPWNLGGGATENNQISGVLGDTYTLNPKTILDLRLAISRVFNDQVPSAAGNASTLALLGPHWAALGKSETVPNVPQTVFNNAPCSGFICVPNAFQNAGTLSDQWNDNVGLVFNLNKLAGKHNLKIGGEARFMDRYIISMVGGQNNQNDAGGNLNFGPTDFTMSEWGNFLLGFPDQAIFATVREAASQNWYQGYYINDTWEATRNLTINAGVRWELPGNVREKHDNSIELEPATNDTTSYPGLSIPGTVVLVNSPQYPARGSEPARLDVFAPNIGFAFRLSDKDVIRAGYGYSIAPIDIATGLFPETYSLNAAPTNWNYQQSGIHYPESNPFPATPLNNPLYSNGSYPTGLNQPIPRSQFTPKSLITQNVLAPVASNVLPTTQQWNLTVSHQFNGDLLIEASYAGSTAKGLPISNNGYSYNELPYNYWNDQYMTQTISGTTSADPLVSQGQFNLCKGVWGTTTYGQCALPYSSYSSFEDAFGPYGFVNYEALPVRVQKRFKSSGQVSASYTWEKVLGNAGGGTGGGPGGGGNVQDWYNLRGEKSLASYSVPRRLVISSILNLPFGHDQAFLNTLSNPVANSVVSGWSVNGITTFQDGFPLGIGVNMPNGTKDIPNTFGSGLRPNKQFGCPTITGGSWKSHVLAGTPVLNNCWSAPPVAYTLGNTGYATTLGNAPRIEPHVKAPGQNNWDISVQKKTDIVEKMNLEFRAEMFNAFNHVRFPAPNTTVNGNGFGEITNGSQGQGEEPRLIQLSLRLNY